MIDGRRGHRELHTDLRVLREWSEEQPARHARRRQRTDVDDAEERVRHLLIDARVQLLRPKLAWKVAHIRQMCAL